MKRCHALALLALSCFAGPAPAVDITVTRFDDPLPTPCTPSDCSLRAAVIYANALAGADRVLLSSSNLGIYQLTQVGADEDGSYSGDLDVRDDLTIEGLNPVNGRAEIAMYAYKDRVIQLYSPGLSGYRLTLNHVTLSGGLVPNVAGLAGSGGCLLAEGNLNLDDVAITGCYANVGGGIYLQGAGVLQHVTIQGGTANIRAGGAYIYSAPSPLTIDDFTVTQSTVTDDSTTAEAGGVYFRLYLGDRLDRVTLDGNTASNCAGGMVRIGFDTQMGSWSVTNNIATVHGGGLCFESATLSANADLRDALISTNTTYYGDGGGLYIKETHGSSGTFSLRLHDSEIDSNIAGQGNSGGNGGGIAFASCADCPGGAQTLALIDSTVSNNQAIVFVDGVSDGTGGGIHSARPLTLLRSSVRGNQASLRGGGMALVDATVGSLIDSSTFFSNATTAGTGNRGGGAVHIDSTSLSIVNSTFDANTSIYGGTLFNQGSTLDVRQTTLAKGSNPVGFQGSVLGALGTGSTSFINSLLIGTCYGVAPTAAVGDMEAGNGFTNSCNLSGSSQPNIALGSLNLGALAFYGGLTPTRKPGAGSAMLGAAVVSQCPSLDQRGYERQNAGVCDVGAVQRAVIDDVIFRDGFN